MWDWPLFSSLIDLLSKVNIFSIFSSFWNSSLSISYSFRDSGPAFFSRLLPVNTADAIFWVCQEALLSGPKRMDSKFCFWNQFDLDKLSCDLICLCFQSLDPDLEGPGVVMQVFGLFSPKFCSKSWGKVSIPFLFFSGAIGFLLMKFNLIKICYKNY